MSNDIQSTYTNSSVHDAQQAQQSDAVPQGTFHGRKVTLLSSSESSLMRTISKRELGECLNQFASLESCNRVLDFDPQLNIDKQNAAVEKLMERKVAIIQRS
ncbi:T3SS regulon translocated regulator ExsE2 [Vibrio alginolyticus]|uniref:T3SS regulon translocated regulator ExsE2 n=1 Tax=Vibrio alginolyticus TaxID=663 RepID=UPI001BD3DE15|nr:T3SS regulon translocated regulator ExsE2 [Vibrio alginolyticus]MBS9861550.1 T3SS regulon translocated regulator ExsE2 [Vibrio alginolyticus]